jgi:hypothetical protein
MNKFDLLYNNLMESMVAGGAGSVFGSPSSGVEIGSTGGAVGVSNDKAYDEGRTVIPHLTFGKIKIQKRPDLNRKKKNKS